MDGFEFAAGEFNLQFRVPQKARLKLRCMHSASLYARTPDPPLPKPRGLNLQTLVPCTQSPQLSHKLSNAQVLKVGSF